MTCPAGIAAPPVAAEPIARAAAGDAPRVVLVVQGRVPLADSREAALYRGYARRVPVVYLRPDPARPAAATRRMLHAALAGLAGRDCGLVEATLPGFVPGSRWRAVAALNRWLATRVALRAAGALTGRLPVLVVQRPDLLPTVRGLPARLAVYEVVDDYPGLARTAAARRRLERAHARMLRTSGLVWATAPTLADVLRARRPDVVLTTNGVDLARFGRTDLPLPPALAGVPRPRVGLVGNLNDRIDWPLLETLCHRHPEWSLVLVGPVHDAGDATRHGLETLARRPNAHRLPGVPEADMPAYLAGLDVCLIPYRETRLTRGINPLKLYQALAVGRPVVATALPALAAFDDVVRRAATPEAFVAAVAAAVAAADDLAACRARRVRAAAFDWDAIAAARLAALGERLARRETRAASAPPGGAGAEVSR